MPRAGSPRSWRQGRQPCWRSSGSHRRIRRPSESSSEFRRKEGRISWPQGVKQSSSGAYQDTKKRNGFLRVALFRVLQGGQSPDRWSADQEREWHPCQQRRGHLIPTSFSNASLCRSKRRFLAHLISKSRTCFLPGCWEARQNGTRITPDLLAGLPRVIIASASAFFGVSSDERSRGAAKQDATGSHPIPIAALAMSGRRFQIVWPLAPL